MHSLKSIYLALSRNSNKYLKYNKFQKEIAIKNATDRHLGTKTNHLGLFTFRSAVSFNGIKAKYNDNHK